MDAGPQFMTPGEPGLSTRSRASKANQKRDSNFYDFYTDGVRRKMLPWPTEKAVDTMRANRMTTSSKSIGELKKESHRVSILKSFTWGSIFNLVHIRVTDIVRSNNLE